MLMKIVEIVIIMIINQIMPTVKMMNIRVMLIIMMVMMIVIMIMMSLMVMIMVTIIVMMIKNNDEKDSFGEGDKIF